MSQGLMNKPNVLFHIGRPDMEKPQCSMERCEKFHEDHPEMKLVIIVWGKKDYDELLAKAHKEKTVILNWEDDAKLMSWFIDNLVNITGAQIVAPRWYECEHGHITAGTYLNKVEHCSVCKPNRIVSFIRRLLHMGKAKEAKLTFVEPCKDKLVEFCDILTNVIKLANFDTTSGQFLSKAVNPVRNVLCNMPYAIGCVHEKVIQCEDLQGSLKGKPALLCAAGPSLEDAIPHIKRLQDKCAICCVGRSYKLLRKHDIRVDYVVSVEMFDWDAAIFEGLTDVQDTVLAFASVCSPPAVKAWPGKRVCLYDPETGAMLKNKASILGGNSVAHHMLNFAAQILEAEPLILVGVDLAYTRPKTHAEGTHPEGWPEDIKKKELEFQDELWVPCTSKGDTFDPWCHRTPVAIGGGLAMSGIIEVRSSPAYQNFAVLFAILIFKHGKKVLNACSNGQKIKGVEYLDLSTYLE